MLWLPLCQQSTLQVSYIPAFNWLVGIYDVRDRAGQAGVYYFDDGQPYKIERHFLIILPAGLSSFYSYHFRIGNLLVGLLVIFVLVALFSFLLFMRPARLWDQMLKFLSFLFFLYSNVFLTHSVMPTFASKLFLTPW